MEVENSAWEKRGVGEQELYFLVCVYQPFSCVCYIISSLSFELTLERSEVSILIFAMVGRLRRGPRGQAANVFHLFSKLFPLLWLEPALLLMSCGGDDETQSLLFFSQ